MTNKPSKEEKLIWNSSKPRTKTASVIQLEAVECGAASLKMVLAYFGRFQTLEKLREDAGVNRDGSKAINILKAARKHGMECKGLKVDDLSDLLDMNFPLIIHWNFNNNPTVNKYVIVFSYPFRRSFNPLIKPPSIPDFSKSGPFLNSNAIPVKAPLNSSKDNDL